MPMKSEHLTDIGDGIEICIFDRELEIHNLNTMRCIVLTEIQVKKLTEYIEKYRASIKMR